MMIMMTGNDELVVIFCCKIYKYFKFRIISEALKITVLLLADLLIIFVALVLRMSSFIPKW